jgi:8-amino-7-oxononanoate synthase
MHNWLDQLPALLAEKKLQGAYRKRKIIGSAQGPVIQINSREYLNFSSNDYLGLANHSEVVSAFQQSAGCYGVGSGASHLVAGHSALHHELEEKLARYTGRERALLFSSGYMANVGTINALIGKGDSVFEDKLNHASLIDAGLASGANFYRYRHGDTAQLQKLLIEKSRGRPLVVTDSVFSMDGDIAQVKVLAQIAEQHGAVLMVDDAHGFGVIGERGGGVASQFNLSQEKLPVLMATLGKAVGVAGAFVAGSEALVETLIQSARNYIYTTALPPACAAAAIVAIDIMFNDAEIQLRLQRNIAYFKKGLQALNIPPSNSTTPIQPLIVGSNEKSLSMQKHLFDRGIYVVAIRPPTVPAGTARLRVSLSAAHSTEQLDRLLAELNRAWQAINK